MGLFSIKFEQDSVKMKERPRHCAKGLSETEMFDSQFTCLALCGRIHLLNQSCIAEQ